MKITSQTEALHTAFQIVGSVVQPRPTRPILATVLLRAADDTLELQATDLEIGIRFTVPDVQIEEEGAIAVPQARVAGILRETADETVTLSTDDRHCVITASDSVFRLPMESAEEFPDLPRLDQEKAYELDRNELVEMTSKTTFAAHKGKHRYALNGVLLVISEKKIEMVATDGRRLAHIERKAENPEGTDESVIVPTKALDQLLKVLTDEDERVRVNIAENQLVAKTLRATISTRLVEGHFPPYESVIPSDCDKKLEVRRESFHSAVRRAALLTSEESSSVVLHLQEGKVEVTSAAPETGEARVEVAVDYSGPALEIGFNPEFLTDFFRAVDDETVRMELRDASSAGILRAGKDFLYVVMPVSRE
ncbi:MAG: DNA polymerase III subunit beta [Candidatus Brocadiia bacterium]